MNNSLFSLIIKEMQTSIKYYYFCYYFGGIQVWTQGLMSAGQALVPFHQLFLYTEYFWDRGSWTICQGWLQTAVLLIAASWLFRITGVTISVHLHILLTLTRVKLSITSKTNEGIGKCAPTFLWWMCKLEHILERTFINV
jgi:hypothetical protein